MPFVRWLTVQSSLFSPSSARPRRKTCTHYWQDTGVNLQACAACLHHFKSVESHVLLTCTFVWSRSHVSSSSSTQSSRSLLLVLLVVFLPLLCCCGFRCHAFGPNRRRPRTHASWSPKPSLTFTQVAQLSRTCPKKLLSLFLQSRSLSELLAILMLWYCYHYPYPITITVLLSPQEQLPYYNYPITITILLLPYYYYHITITILPLLLLFLFVWLFYHCYYYYFYYYYFDFYYDSYYCYNSRSINSISILSYLQHYLNTICKLKRSVIKLSLSSLLLLSWLNCLSWRLRHLPSPASPRAMWAQRPRSLQR